MILDSIFKIKEKKKNTSTHFLFNQNQGNQQVKRQKNVYVMVILINTSEPFPQSGVEAASQLTIVRI